MELRLPDFRDEDSIFELTAASDLARILQSTVEAIADEVVGVDLVAYYELSPSGVFVGRFANKVPVVPSDDGPTIVPISMITVDPRFEGFAAEVLQTGLPVHISHARHDTRVDRHKANLLDMYSLYAIPVKHNNLDVIGMITLQDVGSAMHLDSTMQKVVTSFVTIAGLAISNANITSRLDELVRQRTTELVETNMQLESVVEELRTLDRMKSDFVAAVSHELRTPINILQQVMELFQLRLLGELTDDQQDYLERAMMHLSKLKDQVDDLLDFSRMEGGNFQIRPEHCAYYVIVEDVVNAMEPLADKKNIRLECDVTPVYACVDARRLQQVLINLVSNAIKFTPEYGKVRISLVQHGTMIITSVSDTGIGIKASDCAKIFERFFQVDNSSKRRFNGAGLGLAIVKNLIEMHGGRIWVDSILGKGSTFSFEFDAGGPTHVQ